MLASFINQRGALTSYLPKRLADERQDAKSSSLWCKHSGEVMGLTGLSVNQFGVNVEFIGSLITRSAKWSYVMTVITGTNLLDMSANKVASAFDSTVSSSTMICSLASLAFPKLQPSVIALRLLA